MLAAENLHPCRKMAVKYHADPIGYNADSESTTLADLCSESNQRVSCGEKNK